MSDYDVIVVGLGAMGSHAAMTLAARGARVLGIERFWPAHDRGSHHGDSRIIRLGYFEDPCYVPLLQRAYAAWQEIEKRSGAELLNITGVLQIGRPEGQLVNGVLASCRLHHLAHELLGPKQMAARFPAFQMDADEVAVLEPRGGYLDPERAVLTALRLAGAGGAQLRFGEQVTAIEPASGGVRVRSATGETWAKRVIIATGAYIAGLVPSLRDIARPIRTVVGWFPSCNGQSTALGRMPVFLRQEDDGSFFGFPAIGRDGVKIGKHGHFGERIDPEMPNPPVNERDRSYVEDFARRRLPAVTAKGHKFATCRYTNLPGDDFLVDFLPGHPEIVVASPCSGHGFKFASVLGEILADLALDGATAMPIAPFSFAALRERMSKVQTA
jgi:sarcosine oxidase